MNQRLFFAADQAFLRASAATNLSYEVLNILVYCLLVPGVWFLILSFRLRSAGLALAVLAGLSAAVFVLIRLPQSFHAEFYARNLRQLYFWSSNAEDTYRAVSVALGVLSPAAGAFLIALCPRKFALPVFLSAAAALACLLLSGWFLFSHAGPH